MGGNPPDKTDTGSIPVGLRLFTAVKSLNIYLRNDKCFLCLWFANIHDIIKKDLNLGENIWAPFLNGQL